MQELELIQKITNALDDKKAQDIVALDVRGLTVICDYMIIASGRNVNQVKAMADEVDDFMVQQGLTLRRSEGLNEGRWIVLDYATVLIHIFHQDERAYYNLERLWDDGKNRITLDIEANGEA